MADIAGPADYCESSKQSNMQMFAQVHAEPHATAAVSGTAAVQDSMDNTLPPPLNATEQGAATGAESTSSRQPVHRPVPQYGVTTPANSNAAARAGNLKLLSGGPSALLQRHDDSCT